MRAIGSPAAVVVGAPARPGTHGVNTLDHGRQPRARASCCGGTLAAAAASVVSLRKYAFREDQDAYLWELNIFQGCSPHPIFAHPALTTACPALLAQEPRSHRRRQVRERRSKLSIAGPRTRPRTRARMAMCSLWRVGVGRGVLAAVRPVWADVPRPCSARGSMYVAREVRGTVAILIFLMLCAFMLAALSLLATMLSCHSECCVCVSGMYTDGVHKETPEGKLPSRRSDVAKLSIAILNLSIGPVPGDRPPPPHASTTTLSRARPPSEA